MFPTNFHEAVNSGFAMYIAEAAGRDDLVDTRVAKVNAVIRNLKFLVRNHMEINDYVFRNVCSKHKLYNLTPDEIRKIEREVNGTY